MEIQPPKWLVVCVLVAAVVGFADTAYLTAEHLRGVVPPCTTSGCETVLTSRYAEVGPIPLAAVGLLYYTLLIVFIVGYIDSGNSRFISLLSWVVGAGFLFSLGLVYLQLFVLHAICQYCMASAIITTTIAGLTLAIRRS